jgi:UDP-N-acetylmuramoylalanine--D-glutamate ligase
MSGRSGSAGSGTSSLLAEIPGSRILVDRVDRDTVALARLLRSLGATVTIADTQARDSAPRDALHAAEEQGIRVMWATDLDDADVPFDLLFVHDYTSPLRRFVARARRQGRPVAHWADLLIELSPAPVIGVTGSAGKSTTARLIAEMLGAGGRKVYIPRHHELLGSANPNWELLEGLGEIEPASVMVLELTSSHLEYMRRGPHVAVITTVTPDHIEWHGSIEGYLEAKARILDGQDATGWAVLNYDEEVTWTRFWPRARGEIAGFGGSNADAPGVYVRDGRLALRWEGRDSPLLAIDEVPLPRQYLGNALAAAAAAAAANASSEAIVAGLKRFRGLPGRHELVGSDGEVRVFNDGIALTPRKASAGLRGFPSRSVVLICGGEDLVDGWSVSPLHEAQEERALIDSFAKLVVEKVKRVYAIGPGGRRLREALERNRFDPRLIIDSQSLDHATRAAIGAAERGDNVVLSPVFDVGEANLARFSDVVRSALGERRVDVPAGPGAPGVR